MYLIPLMWAFSLIGAAIHLMFLKPQKKAFGEIVDVVLLYQLIFTVGINSLLGFYAHAYMSDEVAQYIGWPTKSPFQLEVAYTNLTFGILGLLCIFIRGHFWTATALGISIWYWCDAYGHLRDLYVHHNDAPGNAGLPLYGDLVIPAVLLTLLALRQWAVPRRS